jgi:hypothetical protein
VGISHHEKEFNILPSSRSFCEHGGYVNCTYFCIYLPSRSKDTVICNRKSKSSSLQVYNEVQGLPDVLHNGNNSSCRLWSLPQALCKIGELWHRYCPHIKVQFSTILFMMRTPLGVHDTLGEAQTAFSNCSARWLAALVAAGS